MSRQRLLAVLSRIAQRRLMRLAALGALGVLTLAPSGALPTAASSPFASFCARVITSNVGPFPAGGIGASSGALMFCDPPSGAVAAASTKTSSGGTTEQSNTKNVDAGNPREDVSPAGVQAYGQSETSIAAEGSYVVEAWNDATGFFSPPCSPMYKDQLTGYGFSADGGKTWVDEGGLPNNLCAQGWVYDGDPSVEVYQTSGGTYFYISSLFVNGAIGQSDIAMDACLAAGSGTAATLTCNPTPDIIASGVAFNFITFTGGDFLDKDFLSVDAQRGRVYNSYTRFCGFGEQNCLSGAGQIELAWCNLTTNPDYPTCYPGASQAPFLIVQPPDANCENEGAYPAADVATGDVYVGWEYNWATNFEFPNCEGTPTQERIAYIPNACITPTPTSPCVTTPQQRQVNIVSIDAAFMPGYNRFPLNDFPRIAVSDPYGTVSITWNDARYHALGDILMQSYRLATLTPVQPAPIALDSLSQGGAHFLPALRNPNSAGRLNVSWYQRGDPNTTLTDVYANTNIDPTSTKNLSTNTRITNVQTDWNAVSSDIVPNFGDYIDNYVLATATPPYYNKMLYVAWADGRLGLPQPFMANISTS